MHQDNTYNFKVLHTHIFMRDKTVYIVWRKRKTQREPTAK